MKNIIFWIGLLPALLFMSCMDQPDAEQIIKMSLAKCQSVENGYYEMEHHMKYMSVKDTSLKKFKCHFKKLKNDSLYTSAFHYKTFYGDDYKSEVMYTGNEFVGFSTNDSSGSIMAKNLWAKEIQSNSHNRTFYSPILDKDYDPLPSDSAILDKKMTFTYIGEAQINSEPCYHIRNSIPTENDSAAVMKTLSTEINYWINKKDSIPVQYTIELEMVMDNDTMTQFEKKVLKKYEFNDLKEETQLTLSSVPSFVKLKDYEPYTPPKLLETNTIAPNWSLISLENKKVQLSDFKGELVLIDFFYKSCYPCMLALPGLQKLHEKYKDKGLNVIGIDPFDSVEKDDIANFLKKRGVTYTILLGGNDVANAYNVTGYPTIYLIDKKGKVIAPTPGYRENMEDRIEEILLEYL